MKKELSSKILRVIVSIAMVMVLSCGALYSQSNYTSDDPLEKEQTQDTTGADKEVKPRKPLTSYLFSDSTKSQNAFSWNFDPRNSNIELIPIDTMLNDFQRDYIFFQNENAGVIYRGNLGGASIPIDYFNRPDKQEFTFVDAYDSYIFTSDNVPFYNSRKPFTQLSYFMSGQTSKAEEQLRITHAQTISPSSTFNLTYRNNKTKGAYDNDAATDKNLSFAFAHTGKRYTVHAGYIYNMGSIEENGGVTNDYFITDTLIDLPENVPMNLSDAKNVFRGNTFYVTQSYGMPFRRLLEDDEELNLRDKSAIFFGNSIEYTRYTKNYTDDVTEVNEGYYDNWYINPTITADSLSESLFDTKFFLQLQPYSRDGVISLLGGGVGYKNESYYYFQPNDYLFKSEKTKENSVYVYANAQGKFRDYLNWDGEFKYVPIGYRSQDIEFKGNIDFSAYIKNRPVRLSAGVFYRLEEPSYWSQHYYSNHFAWNNSFSKENETRFEASLSIPDYGIELSAKQSVIDNKVYYDANSLPAQYSDALSISAIYLQKDFRIGGLNLKNRVLLQWSSSQEVAPVPLASANGIYYYEFDVVKNVLRLQLGLEGYYNTTYYSFGYNPALMQFYNQRSTQTGDYIWMDAFVTGKWKRVRVLIKMQHLNYELFGDRNYFQIAHSPLNRRMLKFGVSWNFYD